MREFTFNVNNRGEAMVIDDLRAYAIQLSSLIINSSRGLPCNIDSFPALRSFYQEYNNAAVIEQIHDEISRAIRQSMPDVSASIAIDTVEPSAKTGFRPYMSVTIKLSNNLGDAGTIVMGVNSNQNGVELKDIKLFR